MTSGTCVYCRLGNCQVKRMPGTKWSFCLDCYRVYRAVRGE